MITDEELRKLSDNNPEWSRTRAIVRIAGALERIAEHLDNGFELRGRGPSFSGTVIVRPNRPL